jgi:hypothetical protein
VVEPGAACSFGSTASRRGQEFAFQSAPMCRRARRLLDQAVGTEECPARE